MLIPIGHDQYVMRRRPVVTLAIIAMCTAIFLAEWTSSTADADRERDLLVDAVRYYLQYPYLTPHPLVRQALDAALKQAPDEIQEAVTERLEHPPEARLLTLRQEELDRLTQPWIDLVTQQVSWRWGLVPARYSPIQLLTYMFLHAGLMHLIGNMIFLWVSGPIIEDVWGRPLFILFYLISGVVSAALFMMHYPDMGVPLIGASGAIAGVLGAFLVRYPLVKIKFSYLFFFRFRTFFAPAWLMLPLWAAGELYQARLMDADTAMGNHVAYWAHVWGFAFGMLVAVLVQVFDLERFIKKSIDLQLAMGDNPLLNDVQRALANDRTAEACSLLQRELTRDPRNEEAARIYWGLLLQLDRVRDGGAIFYRIAQAKLRDGDEEAALRDWEDLRERLPECDPDLPFQITIAECLLRQQRWTEAQHELQSAFNRTDRQTGAAILLQLAKAALALDPELAAAAAARAREYPGLAIALREEIDTLQQRAVAACGK